MAGNKEYEKQLSSDGYYRILELLGVSYDLQKPADGQKYTDMEMDAVRKSIQGILYNHARENPDKKDEFVQTIKDPKNHSEWKIGAGARKHLAEKLEKVYNNIASSPEVVKEEEVSPQKEVSGNADSPAKIEQTEEPQEEEPQEEEPQEEEPQGEKVEEKTEGKTTVAEAILEREPEEPVHDDLAWIEEKRKFWKEYAADTAHEYKEKNTESNSEPTFECSFAKGDESKGSVKYTSRDRVEISRDSKLVMYLGVIKDVVQSGNTLTLGETLSQTQKLMFYAAALSSTERYEDGSKIQVMNPPALTPEVLKSKEFEALDSDVVTSRTIAFVNNQFVVNEKTDGNVRFKKLIYKALKSEFGDSFTLANIVD